jgi:hypothetical protein
MTERRAGSRLPRRLSRVDGHPQADDDQQAAESILPSPDCVNENIRSASHRLG